MPTVDEIEIGQYALAVRPVDTTFRVDDQREYGEPLFWASVTHFFLDDNDIIFVK